MKKMNSLLIILVTLVSLGFITQAVANQCASSHDRCADEGAECDRGDNTKGVCTQLVRGGSNLPAGCYCRRAQLTLLPIGMLPDINGLTLQEAYEVQAELDQLQDAVDDHIMDLESAPNFRLDLTK